MAEQVLPQHQPHDQLRTEPAAQREHTDKYVTAFQSGKSDTDITFTNPVLPKSADHFKVGVDELTVNLGKISMLDYGDNDIVFRIIRRGRDDIQYYIDDLLMPDAATPPLDVYKEAFAFTADRPYLSFQGIIDRLVDMNRAVNQYFIENPLYGAPYDFPADFRDQRDAHVLFEINARGLFVVRARASFWANFVIQVPLAKYRSILFDDVDLEFLSLHPLSGQLRKAFEVGGGAGQYVTNAFNDAIVYGADGFDNFGDDEFAAIEDDVEVDRVYYGTPSLFQTLDRRVTVEVGCSLPLKNSPMIDHGVEAPDYVLGRYRFHKPLAITTGGLATGAINATFESQGLGTQQLQGPRDRICYHHLQPQQKISTLRLKLWLRVRSYDETLKKWGMRTIVCPVKGSDYWHIRLHFTLK